MESEIYQRKTIFAELEQFDILCEKHSYIEITEWHNGEGIDININNRGDKHTSLTFGELKAIKKLTKKLLK